MNKEEPIKTTLEDFEITEEVEKKINKYYYRTDEYKDCIDNFDFFYECFYKYLKGDIKSFKWIILSLYMFLQGLFVLSLRGTNSFNVQKNEFTIQIDNKKYKVKLNFSIDKLYKIDYSEDKKITTIWLNQRYNTESNLKELGKSLNNEGINITYKQLVCINKKMSELISFNELYERVKKNEYISYIHSSTLPKKDEFEHSIKRLIAFRNDFIHFSPSSWLISYALFYEIVPNCLDIAIFLINDYNMPKESDRKNTSYLPFVKIK